MDAENSSDEPMDDTSVDTNSTDTGSDTVNKADSSLSDDESFDDSSVNGNEIEDEEVTAIEDNEVKSRNNPVQRKTFNLQKKRSLVKPMVMTTTTGYILTIFGPFYSDFHNNDASILKHVMRNNYEDILNWVQENDIMILDRGFRDSLGVLKALGIDAAMPSFLDTGR
ncbi:unnamed protein product [Rotaria sp. Silwood2]|nr:unnamed protein product [Rotaria sp. Silwood2]